LKIRGLKKRYSGGYLAVESVDMTMYKGQIFALLGHNGAGKTTTISMLTGLIEPTEGSATVDGYDIFESMDRLRENLGVCP
jgi:ABC-type multidrug transport system ATPase subunit